jgi:glucose/arabinose dehydrogenase
MGKAIKIALGLLGLGSVVVIAILWYMETRDQREPSRLAFLEHCASCHSANGSGPDLLTQYHTEDSADGLINSILVQHSDLVAEAQIPEPMVKALALYVIEQRQELPSIADSHAHTIPKGVVESQHHDFKVELITEVGKGPYSIAPLPDGRTLLVEKVRGLSVIDASGKQGDLVEGTPRVWSEIAQMRGSFAVLGSMLDVELHPDYASNGWIYLSHSDRCQLDCGSPWPVTMVRVIRGRLVGNRWTDSEVIWSVDKDKYTVVPDAVASGRLAFDHQGFGYVTVGGKSTYDNLHVMDTPYGKIHRFSDNGSVPEDNPFWQGEQLSDPTSSRNTVWSYGHRTAQGLTTDPRTGDIWATEMGPRGGDEINMIRRGGNYGWPLYTEGLDYNAEYISIGKDLGLDFEFSETIPPVVDFTPAPSLSNFTFHNGDQFPNWQSDLLVGSLRAQTLFRVRIEKGKVVEKERLLTKLGRIRDVEMGYDGFVYVLIEHNQTGSLLRLIPTS